MYNNSFLIVQKCIALETLLRGIYELESGFDDGPPTSTRIPNVNLPSIYHDVSDDQ
jgi:hypothetical protein